MWKVRKRALNWSWLTHSRAEWVWFLQASNEAISWNPRTNAAANLMFGNTAPWYCFDRNFKITLPSLARYELSARLPSTFDTITVPTTINFNFGALTIETLLISHNSTPCFNHYVSHDLPRANHNKYFVWSACVVHEAWRKAITHFYIHNILACGVKHPAQWKKNCMGKVNQSSTLRVSRAIN